MGPGPDAHAISSKGFSMKTAILHLSDIHIDNARHPILNRADRIARAVASTGHAIDHIVLVVSGDIAWSGTEAQYKFATTFLDALSTSLKHVSEGAELSWVFVPGNHDCDLTLASDVRQPDMIEPKARGPRLERGPSNTFSCCPGALFSFHAPLRRRGIHFTIHAIVPQARCSNRQQRTLLLLLQHCLAHPKPRETFAAVFSVGSV